MDTAESVEPAGVGAGPAAAPGLGVGLMLGLFGHLAALVAFGYEGLFTGRADAADQLWAGLAVAYLVALVAVVATVVAVFRTRRSRPRFAAGLLGGTALGVVLIVLLTVRVVGVMGDVTSTCPCEPIIDQVRTSGG